MVQIHGTCADEFTAVREAFAANFDNGEELGASVAVTVEGQFVVDLWAGDADESATPWARDTIVNVYSTTKTMAHLCMLMLADRGELDFSAPVASYWPEFAQNGKQGVLVSHVMAHSSGLSGWQEPLTAAELYDWDKLTGLLAAQEPWWESGAAVGYHAFTQGYLQGEILGRITGESIDSFFRREVSGPLGADFHFCLDPEHDDRVGDLVPPPALGDEMLEALELGGMAAKSLANPRLTALEPRTREWRAALIPAAGGLGNARSVARVHSAMACGGSVDGVRLLSQQGVEAVLEEQIRGHDQVLGAESRFGMGFGLGTELMPLPDRCFYWGGWGGSLAIIDLERQLTISYVMNRMAGDLTGDMRGATVALAALAGVS